MSDDRQTNTATNIHTMNREYVNKLNIQVFREHYPQTTQATSGFKEQLINRMDCLTLIRGEEIKTYEDDDYSYQDEEGWEVPWIW